MKNILNVNKISLKPIFMSLAILFAVGVSIPHYFEKSVEASNQSSQTPKFKEEEEFSEDDENPDSHISNNPNNPYYILTNHYPTTNSPFDAEEEVPEYEPNDDKIEEEEEDLTDVVSYNGGNNNVNGVKNFQKKEAADPSKEEDTSKSKNDTCPSIFKCSLA